MGKPFEEVQVDHFRKISFVYHFIKKKSFNEMINKKQKMNRFFYTRLIIGKSLLFIISLKNFLMK